MTSRSKYRNVGKNIYKTGADMTKQGISWSFQTNLAYALAKDDYTATSYDDFFAISMAVRDRLVERWISTQQRYHKQNVKRVYYLSLEFLIGRLLGTNMLNLGLLDQTKEAMEEMGFDVEELRECESDAGLGNGGLGRLAACFLDSMATLGVPAHGYGIRYEYGIFKQKIVNGYQVEHPDTWLNRPNPWEFPRPEYTVKIRFNGHTRMYNDDKGRLRVEWTDTDDVFATPYDVPVPGYKNHVVNTLRLWSARSTEEFDLRYFNEGDYERAVNDKVLTENISKVLYPSDRAKEGRELRLKQEYFFTAATIADILRRFKAENSDLKDLPDKAAIQLNDTHPSIAVAELMRVLVDEECMGWEEAWEITKNTIAYTNHTIMQEALEAWPVDMFERILPRHLQIIYEINFRFLQEAALKFPGDGDRLKRLSIVEEGNPKKILMGNLAVIGSHSVNGVSELHSELIKKYLFRDFYELFPEKFNNKTNGVTQRRWLDKANPELSRLIKNAIGDKWTTDLYQLKKLMHFKDDSGFLERWQEIKDTNKKALSHYIRREANVVIDPESIFDVQVKRIHEYKRQLLLCLYILSLYLKIKSDPNTSVVPRTFILSGKAAPSYFMAKLIIKFINSIGDVINRDAGMKDRLKVVFLENYRVSLAEKIFPASDISEQISTAGMEASGTGCMKFMLNGALTVGTFDGANLEMAKEVGHDNIFLFGHKAQEIQDMKMRGYDPQYFIENSALLKETVELIRRNFLSPVEFGLFNPILDSICCGDYFFVCADFDSYCEAQHKISTLYKNRDEWARKAIINLAKSGKFSSDRTIMEYADDIWHVPAGSQK